MPKNAAPASHRSLRNAAAIGWTQKCLNSSPSLQRRFAPKRETTGLVTDVAAATCVLINKCNQFVHKVEFKNY